MEHERVAASHGGQQREIDLARQRSVIIPGGSGLGQGAEQWLCPSLLDEQVIVVEQAGTERAGVQQREPCEGEREEGQEPGRSGWGHDGAIYQVTGASGTL